MELENNLSGEQFEKVQTFKRRMLQWSNPVEYVNNMYGAHPDGDGDYFSSVFGE